MDPSPPEVEVVGVKLKSRENSPTLMLEVNHGGAPNGEEPPIAFTRVVGLHHGEVVNQCESSRAQSFKRFVGPLIASSSTTNSIALNWSNSFLFNFLPNNTKFKIEIRMCTSFAWTMVYYGSATSHLVTGLPADTEVGVRLYALDTDWSWEALYKTLPGPPDAPLMAKALNIGSNEVELVWRPPVHDGGSSITSFCVEMEMQGSAWREVASTSFATVGSSTDNNFVAKELEPGSTYCFRVQACNKLGAGPYSRFVVVETLPAPPAIPEPPVVVEQTSKSMSLSWLSPPCNGASVHSFNLQMTVLGYGLPASFDRGPREHYDPQPATLTNGEDQRVHTDLSTSALSNGTNSEDDGCNDGTDGAESETVSNIYSGPSQEFEVKKLRPFSSYAFRVQAQNAVGSSGFSAYLVCTTSAGPPCPPPPPTVVDAKSSALTLKWEVPKRDNGYPVVRYTLEMQEQGSSNAEHMNVTGKKLEKRKVCNNQDVVVQLTTTRVWVVVYDGHELLSQITGLAPCHEYKFRVKAQNKVGTSSPSSALVAMSLPDAPGAPQPPTFHKVTTTSVETKWLPPANDNGMPVTSYKVLFDDGHGGQLQKVCEGEAQSFSMPNLVPSSSYRAVVQAINACGASNTSEVAVVETLPVAQTPQTPSHDDHLHCKETPRAAVPATPKPERPVPAMSVVPKRERPTVPAVLTAPKPKRLVHAIPVLLSPPETERLAPRVSVLLPPPKIERLGPEIPVLVPPPKTGRRVPPVWAVVGDSKTKRRGPTPVAGLAAKTERGVLVVAAPKRTTVVALDSESERAVPATTDTVGARRTKRPIIGPTDYIKSKKEVKELVKRAHQSWFRKFANFLWQNVRQIQPLWLLWILLIALFSYVFGLFLSSV